MSILSVNFGSNSTIDSVKTVRHVGQSKDENEDDQGKIFLIP